jgi:hypothetical protein
MLPGRSPRDVRRFPRSALATALSLSLWKGRTVRTWAEHNAVVSATRMANGVTDVIDELEVTS